jgi:hypothetical protein
MFTVHQVQNGMSLHPHQCEEEAENGTGVSFVPSYQLDTGLIQSRQKRVEELEQRLKNMEEQLQRAIKAAQAAKATPPSSSEVVVQRREHQPDYIQETISPDARWVGMSQNPFEMPMLAENNYSIDPFSNSNLLRPSSISTINIF